MKLLVGLGNPGNEYSGTRHNVGFEVVDQIVGLVSSLWEKDKYCQSLVAISKSLICAKPQTYMNSSGEAVCQLLKKFKLGPKDLIVIHDDLDIALGQYKFQLGIGPKDHGGMGSIQERLKTNHFERLRIGIENRDQGIKIPGEIYVLQKFTNQELN